MSKKKKRLFYDKPNSYESKKHTTFSSAREYAENRQLFLVENKQNLAHKECLWSVIYNGLKGIPNQIFNMLNSFQKGIQKISHLVETLSASRFVARFIS